MFFSAKLFPQLAQERIERRSPRPNPASGDASHPHPSAKRWAAGSSGSVPASPRNPRLSRLGPVEDRVDRVGSVPLKGRADSPAWRSLR